MPNIMFGIYALVLSALPIYFSYPSRTIFVKAGKISNQNSYSFIRSCDDSSLKAHNGKANVLGYHLTKLPTRNKGVSFTDVEVDRFGLRGLYPVGKISLELKLQNVMNQLRTKSTPLEKYIYLHTIQDNDETLYYGKNEKLSCI